MVETFALHGGAGNWEKRKERGQKEIERIADKVKRECKSKPSVETVEYAVNLLEENREFNAGKGAKFEADGEIRLDASIMKSNLEAGSVIGLQNVLNPISVARKIMEKTHHVSMKGKQAEEFAERFGFEKEDLETEYRRESYREVKNRIEGLEFKDRIRELEKENMKGTVGAVALDSKGRMASATSTGGVHGQLAGRIGDTPMPGCGTYSNSEAAVSATGVGEAIIKTTLTRRCTEFMEQGESISKAVEKALRFLKEETGQTAGLIAVNIKGEISADFNSDEMVWTERKNI